MTEIAEFSFTPFYTDNMSEVVTLQGYGELQRHSQQITITFKQVTYCPNVKMTLHMYPLLVVWDDTSDKVRLGVVQRGHEFGQRLLVELSHCAEHPLLGL